MISHNCRSPKLSVKGLPHYPDFVTLPEIFIIFITENVKGMRKKPEYLRPLAVLVLLLTVACSRNKDTYEMRISEKVIEMKATGGQAEIILYHTNDWMVDNREESWCAISPVAGKGDGEPASIALMISVSDNPTSHVRNNIVTIRSGSEVKVFLVTQDAAGIE